MLLIEKRNERLVTQASLAKKLNRPQSFVSKYENGERRLDVIEFLNVMKALDIDPCDFIEHLNKVT